ncbi:MAG TPA: hypothetical protein VF108_06315 [Actinomycetota bacterium]
MKRLGTIVVAVLAMLSLGAAPAGAKGDPQGPHIREWFCILDLGTWHCVPPGVLATSGGPSEPSVNWECDDPADPLCSQDDAGAVVFGPPDGTHFAGTENLIRADLYAGQPCPQGTSGFVPLPFGDYQYCHHYAH